MHLLLGQRREVLGDKDLTFALKHADIVKIADFLIEVGLQLLPSCSTATFSVSRVVVVTWLFQEERRLDGTAALEAEHELVFEAFAQGFLGSRELFLVESAVLVDVKLFREEEVRGGNVAITI